MEFEWDPSKSEKNRRERGFGFDVATLIFEGETVEVEDGRMDYGEMRLRAIGEVASRLLVVIYTDRGEVRRIISAWVADKRERAEWRRHPR